MAIKFFIQKDLSTEMQAELCETITVRFMILALRSRMSEALNH